MFTTNQQLFDACPDSTIKLQNGRQLEVEAVKNQDSKVDPRALVSSASIDTNDATPEGR